MNCKHNYWYSQGAFRCKKCGHVTYKSYQKRNNKLNGAIIGIVSSAIVILFFVGLPYINPNIQIPNQSGQIQLPKFSELPQIKLPVSIPISVTNLTTIANKPQQLLQEITSPQQTRISDSQKAVDYINQLRTGNGEKPITFDQRVFNVALARAKDNYDYGYFDHTNPKTGTCAYTIKSQFGLTSNEDVAENLYMEEYGNTPTLTNPQLNAVVDSWMSDFGHKHNLLFPDHVSGAVACYGGICAFEGLNYQGFGHGCYTASQGEAQYGKLDNCSPEQVNQYLALEQKLDAMKPQLQNMPSVATTQAQYDYYNGLVTQYNSLVNRIGNFTCS